MIFSAVSMRSSWNSSPPPPRPAYFPVGDPLIDSAGKRFTADWIDTIGEPTADLRSDIAAEARAKIVYERLIKQCDDPGLKDTLTFLMTVKIAHQKMFEAALDSITDNFPPGTLPVTRSLATSTCRLPTVTVKDR